MPNIESGFNLLVSLLKVKYYGTQVPFSLKLYMALLSGLFTKSVDIMHDFLSQNLEPSCKSMLKACSDMNRINRLAPCSLFAVTKMNSN